DFTRTGEDLLVLQPVELATLPASSGARDAGAPLDRPGRLAVADADEPVALEGERGQAGQRALPAPGVVPEPAPALRGHPDGPDRQLVADHDDLVAAPFLPRVGAGRAQPRRERGVRLTPGRAHRVPEVRVVARAAQDLQALADGPAPQPVPGRQQPVVDAHRWPVAGRDRRRGLAGPFERRAVDG